MAKQDSRDLEIEEEWEEYSGIIKGSVKAILQDLHESCGIIDRDEDDTDKNLSSIQQLDELQENNNNLSGETSRETTHLASVASRTLPDNFTQDTRSQMSSNLMSSSSSSKVLCHDCSIRPDGTENLASAGVKYLLNSANEKEIGEKEINCAECEKPIRSAETILNSTESDTPGAYRSAIEKILREMSDRESNGRKELEMMNYQNREFHKKTDTLRNDINRRREELKELVDRHADSLLVEADTWRDEVSKVQGAEIERLSRYVDSLDSYKASCNEILVDASLTGIEQVAVDMDEKARDLRKIPVDGFHGLFHGFRVSLKKTNIEEFLTNYLNNNNNIVGVLEEDSDIQDFEQISEENKIYPVNRYDFPTRISRLEKFRQGFTQRDENGDRIVYRDEPVLVGTLRTNAADKEDRGILGVAFLDDELFVISRERSEVEVFDCRRFIFSCELDLDCLLNPEDIGSCANRKCLYIMDRKKDRSRSEILKVDTDGKLIRRWSTGGQWGRISVTPESNILLCMYKTQTLNEYTSDGILLRVIQFAPDTGLDHPRHAVKLANGQFLIGHGETGDAVHRVVKIDARGKVMGSFPGSREDLDEEMTMMMRRPFYLAADAEGQCVFVADTDNRRVLMLNNALELKRELISGDRHGLRYPARLCIDSSRGLLFVADNKVGDKRILVFLIK